MTSSTGGLLRDILLDPHSVFEGEEPDWELLIRHARVSLLMTRLAVDLQDADVYDRVPLPARRYLDVALNLRDRQRVAAMNEIQHVKEALDSIDVPPLLLKGAAYIASELPPARLRVFSDFDILVPYDRLADVELAMLNHGWVTTHTGDYDQRYYRKWMHELPPMRHAKRQSYLDIHHNILPQTAVVTPDATQLREFAEPASAIPGVQVLCPEDMILHGVVHLFQDGEFDRGLRDLFDIRDLLMHFCSSELEWQRLLDRAALHDLLRPLYYAVEQLRLQLALEVPAAIQSRLGASAPAAPIARLMRGALRRALVPPHETCSDRLTAPCKLVLFSRGHALKMPPHLLALHLGRKTLQGVGVLPKT